MFKPQFTTQRSTLVEQIVTAVLDETCQYFDDDASGLRREIADHCTLLL